MTNNESPTIEILAEGLTREWRYDDALVIYTVRNFSEPVMDAYLKSCTLLVQNHQPHYPEYGIHHFDVARLNISSRLYRQLMSLADVLREHHHRAVAAVVFPDMWIFRSLKTLAEFFVARSGN